MSESAPSATPVSKTHWYHRHGDIEIRSLGGTILRADSWRLAAASKVFADMMEVTSENTAEVTTPTKRKSINMIEPIEIDQSSKIISYLLDLVNQANPTTPPSGYDETTALYDLCDKFVVVDRIRSRVSLRIEQVGSHRQWNLLVFAGARNDVPLARTALSMMNEQTFSAETSDEPQGAVLYNMNFRQRMAILPESWQLELYRKAFETPSSLNDHSSYSYSSSYGMKVRPDWKALAIAFQPAN
ncbi:uncharacterized protein I303_100801 [Kwoniella dejecticola CBS 10117]|uniref:BTB domain-containing protein n=1 Tax=Kwoniella dejecticola CBS 10117 TaxID=1296121 RepID=A0A1A6AG24_9TREE|nr:uncharacterized protein I303_00803 [Kwoniella dejecticola CBS 10117]OBR88983.1 hypothetical protein I303_00803 [Kwoniella dejecticola CBS 10117]